jgi:hypothetical protein
MSTVDFLDFLQIFFRSLSSSGYQIKDIFSVFR